MRPVTQDRFPAGQQRGNCLSAVVASLLELELEEVPHFVQDDVDTDGAKNWWTEMVRFINRRGYDLVPITLEPGGRYPEPEPGEFYTVTGISPRDPGVHHIVIYRDGEMVHDPHPDRAGLASIDADQWHWTLRPASQPRCPSCGRTMESGGFALACGRGGQSTRINLPPACTSPECAADRDQAAIAAAIERGVITP